MSEVKELEERLDRLLKARPDLADAGELQRELLQQSYAERPNVRAPQLSEVGAQAKLANGVPLLHREDVNPDFEFCRDLFGRLLNRLQRRPQSAESASVIARAAATELLDFERALSEALVNHGDHLAELAILSGAPAEALASVLELVVRPPLQALGGALLTRVKSLEEWSRGYCPICGAWPGLAELQMAEQHRHLRCLRCGADWPARRLVCVFCGNDDFRSLGYLQVERELRFRVELCERCKGYLKAGNAFEPNRPAALVLDDLASVHLDLAALERGYARPGPSGFRLEIGAYETAVSADAALTDG